MEKFVENWRAFVSKENRKQKLNESRARRLDEVSQHEADEIMDWFGDDYSLLSFDKLFKGKLRMIVPLVSEESKILYKIVDALKKTGWEVPTVSPDDPRVGSTVSPFGKTQEFPTKKVKQKLRRLDNGEEYEEERTVADLRLEKTRTITIPKGPRAGETITKTDETTMSRAILKNKSFPQELKDWWNKNQTKYTKDKQWKLIETAFANDTAAPSNEMMAVLSRHPLDVLRMSDIGKIHSCHSEGDSYFKCARAEAKGHGPIAYLITPEDHEKLMSGEHGASVSDNDRIFRQRLLGILATEEGLNGRWSYDPPENMARYFKDEIFQNSKYAEEYFIPKHEEKFEGLGYGADWLTVKNVKAAAGAVLRTTGRAEQIDKMEELGYKAPPEGDIEYDKKKKRHDIAIKGYENRKHATTWLMQYFERFPKVLEALYKSLYPAADRDIERTRQIWDGITASDRGGFFSLPADTAAVLTFSNIIGAVEPAMNRASGARDNISFDLNGLAQGGGPNPPPEAPVPVETDGKITDISDLDDQEIFRDRERNVPGILAISRLRMRKFDNDAEGYEFAVPEARTYGRSVPGFLSAVSQWSWEEQKSLFRDEDGVTEPPDSHFLERSGGSYEDNPDGTLLNNFFNNASDITRDPYSHSNVSHEYDEDEEEDLAQQWDEAISDIVDAHNRSYTQASLSAEVVDEDGAPYVMASGGIQVEILLKGYQKFRDADANDDGTGVENSYNRGATAWIISSVDEDGNQTSAQVIPKPYGAWNDKRREFEKHLEGYEHAEEISWELATGNKAGEVYLRVDYNINCEDCNDPDGVDNFGDYLADWDNNVEEMTEHIRIRLVNHEIIDGTHYDNKAANEDHNDWAEGLKYFSYVEGDGEMWFTLKSEDGTQRHLPTGVPFSVVAREGGRTVTQTDAAVRAAKDAVRLRTAKVFVGSRASPAGMTYVPSLGFLHTGADKELLDKELRRLESEANAYVQKQMSLDFEDPKYDKPEDSIGVDLAKQAELTTTVTPSKDWTELANTSGETYALGFAIRIIIKSVDTEEEVEAAFKFVEYIDKNIDRVKDAFAAIQKEAIEKWEEKEKQASEAKSSRGTMNQIVTALDTYINNMDFEPLEPSDPRFNSRLAAAVAFLEWNKQAWDHMRKYEREVWIANYLRPLQQGNSMEWESGAHWLFPRPNSKPSAPRGFEAKVQELLANLGATDQKIRNYEWTGVPYAPIAQKVFTTDPDAEEYTLDIPPVQEIPSAEEVEQARAAQAHGDRPDVQHESLSGLTKPQATAMIREVLMRRGRLSGK